MNGYKNYETWNVALWISSDYALYSAAIRFMESYKGRSPYRSFINMMGMSMKKTGDRVAWISKSLSYSELNRMMRDLID